MTEWTLYAQQRWAGKRVQRLEDPGMLTGTTRYVTDIQLPRMLELAFVRSPVPNARIASIDLDPARDVPGVRAVLAHADLAHVHPTQDFVELDGALKTPRVTLPADRVRYVGEPVAAVIAEDRYAAEDGADAVILELEALDDDEPIHDAIPGGRYFHDAAAHGDVAGAFAPRATASAAGSRSSASSPRRSRRAGSSPTTTRRAESSRATCRRRCPISRGPRSPSRWGCRSAMFA